MSEIKIDEVRKIRRGEEYYPSFYILDADGHIDKSIAFASAVYELEFLDMLEDGTVLTTATYDSAKSRLDRAFISFEKLTAAQTELLTEDAVYCFIKVQISSGVESVRLIKFEVYG